MNLIYLALLCGLIATSFVRKSEARLHAESIIGGTASGVRQNTYAVSIQKDGRHGCGGAILNSRFIISVAHCFMEPGSNIFRNSVWTVVAGVRQAHNKQERSRVEREIAKIYVSREFNPIGDKVADLAVLELALGLGLNQFITRVVLPAIAGPHPTYANERAIVVGYGHNYITMRHDPHTNTAVEVCRGSYCYERRFAQVNILSNNACRPFFGLIEDSHLCGHVRQRSPAEPEGLCTGDSGGPLVMGSSNTLIGLVSRSPTVCRENLEPAIYTRITSFLPFILNVLNGHRTPDMRLAEYEVGRDHTKVLVER